jgi:tetratricopeptide (TPR) repeat protein
MTRCALPAALAVGFLVASGPRAGAQDEVTYYDHAEKKEVRGVGSIESETTAGLQFKDRGGVKLIPAVDVRHVAYKNDKVSVVEFRTLAAREDRALSPGEKAEARQKALAEVLKNYEEMVPKLKGAPAALRYVQFKIAQIKFHLSRNDTSQLDAALAALKDFLVDHDKAWETVPSLKMLALVQEAKGDREAAVRTYQELAALPDLAADLKRDSAILEGKLLLREGKFAETEKKFQGLLAGVTAKDRQWAVLQVLLTRSQMGQNNLAKAEEQLKAALAASDEAAVKAMAFNTRGDYFLKMNKPEEAFWNYLRVDTLYGEDREEQAKSLYHLARLFETVKKDPARAQRCREKLRLLEGTEYQKKAASDAVP